MVGLEADDVDSALISFHRDQIDEYIQIYCCQSIPPERDTIRVIIKPKP